MILPLMTNQSIISIRANSISSRVNLELSGGQVLILLADDIVKLRLSKATPVDDSLYKKIIEATVTLLLRDYALRQVNLSPKNKHILLPKIKQQLKIIIKKYLLPKDIDYSSIIESLIKTLENKKYLSDSDLANYLIRKHSKKSPMYIRQVLSNSGIDPLHYLSELPSSTNQIQEIKRQINKKIKSTLDLDDRVSRQKIMASIYRKGFSLTNINRAIDEIRHNG